MSSQTIQSVPSWAQPIVQQYAAKAWNLSREIANVPLVLITSGMGATGQAVLDGAGAVAAINVTAGGNYYSEVPTVAILSDSGSSATAHAVLTSGVVTGIVVDTPGSGYTTPPTVQIQSIGAGATATAAVSGAAVSAITVTAGGSGYATAPTVVIYGGGGSGAAAHAHLTSTSVSSIDMDSGGWGYSNLVGTTFAAYSGAIVAPQNATETAGIVALAARGASGNQTIRDAEAFAKNVIEEGKLTGLPVALTGKISSQGVSAFAQVSALIGKKALYPSTDIPLATTFVASVPLTYIARLNAKLENANYYAERASQDVSLGLAVEFAKQAAIDAEALRKAGFYMREYTQSTYELNHKRFIENQELSVFTLEIFGNMLRAISGSQQTSTGPDYGASPLMQAVGIATASAGIYSALSAAGVFAAEGTGAAIAGSEAAFGASEVLMALAALA